MLDSPSAQHDTTALIRAAQAGDRAAFEALVCQFDRGVWQLARRLAATEQDAQEIYQDTFLKAYRSLHRFRFECAFSTWLYRIAANTNLDYLRRQAVRKELPAGGMPAEGEAALPEPADRTPGGNPEQLLLSAEISARLEAALGGLNPRERMVFELRHYEGLKLKAIGDLLATSEETAKNSLFRATRKLRAALADLHAAPAVTARRMGEVES
ncbi:MAG: RNA polymerase sigma factor [Terriglobales bacterium]